MKTLIYTTALLLLASCGFAEDKHILTEKEVDIVVTGLIHKMQDSPDSLFIIEVVNEKNKPFLTYQFHPWNKHLDDLMEDGRFKKGADAEAYLKKKVRKLLTHIYSHFDEDKILVSEYEKGEFTIKEG